MARIKREGVNHIIQGGSADILKLSLIELFYDNPFGEDLKILMTVHDEVVFELKEERVEEIVLFVVSVMESNEQQFLGEIPAKVDYSVGPYWGKV